MVASDYRAAARQHMKGQWGTLVIIYLVYSIIIGAVSCTGIGLLLLGGALALGFTACTMNVVRGQKVDVSNLFDGFKDFVRSLVLFIVMGIFIALWSMLFIIPGIVKTYSYSMAYFILKDNPEMSALDAITKSREMMAGNKWKLFCLDFSFIGWILLSSLTFGILLFWIEPYMQVAHAEFYENLKGNVVNATATKAETV